MKVKLKNKHLIEATQFLQELRLKGSESRARTKFVELLDRSIDCLGRSEIELVKEYAILGEDGEIEFGENGTYNLRENVAEEFFTEKAKLFEETAEIEGGTYTTHLETMLKILEECDIELSGEQAVLYDVLCEAFEEAVKEREVT